MEHISKVQLVGESTTTGSALQKPLSSADGLGLTSLLEAALKRWPNQDQQETIEEYLADYEALTLRYSLRAVQEAMAELRIDPRQEFFPKPNEVAAEIERQRLRRVPSHIYARG